MVDALLLFCSIFCRLPWRVVIFIVSRFSGRCRRLVKERKDGANRRGGDDGDGGVTVIALVACLLIIMVVVIQQYGTGDGDDDRGEKALTHSPPAVGTYVYAVAFTIRWRAVVVCK